MAHQGTDCGGRVKPRLMALGLAFLTAGLLVSGSALFGRAPCGTWVIVVAALFGTLGMGCCLAAEEHRASVGPATRDGESAP